MYSYDSAGQIKSDLEVKPFAERERALWIASGQYMSGQITKEQLEVKERLYAPHLFSSGQLPQQATRETSLWNRCKEAVLELIDG